MRASSPGAHLINISVAVDHFAVPVLEVIDPAALVEACSLYNQAVDGLG